MAFHSILFTSSSVTIVNTTIFGNRSFGHSCSLLSKQISKSKLMPCEKLKYLPLCMARKKKKLDGQNDINQHGSANTKVRYVYSLMGLMLMMEGIFSCWSLYPLLEYLSMLCTQIQAVGARLYLQRCEVPLIVKHPWKAHLLYCEYPSFPSSPPATAKYDSPKRSLY